MKKLRGLVLSLCLMAVAGCTNFDAHSEVKALNEAQAVGNPFTQNLSAEYRDYANIKLDKFFDYPDALHFARKGLAAAAGEVVLPEPVSDWNLLPAHLDELSTARGRLIVAFDGGAREIAPKESALAQSRFDCWIEQQEEHWNDGYVIPCKAQFADALKALEDLVGRGVPAPIEATAPPAEPMKKEDAMYLVFFDFDSAKITDSGASVLDAVANEAKGRSLNAVKVIGHADTSGPKSYNNKLAAKRANAVRDALSKRGIDASIIKVEGRGEDELLVKTLDNVREPANRRAQVTFE